MFPSAISSLPPLTIQWPEHKKPKSIIKKDAQERYLQTLQDLEYQSPIMAMATVPQVLGTTTNPASRISTIHPPPSIGGTSSVTDVSSIGSFGVQAGATSNMNSGFSTALSMAWGDDPLAHHRHRDSYDEYVLIFNRSTGGPRVHYLMVDPTKRGRLLPKVNYVTMSKIKDLVSYRVVVLDNYLYILGGRNLESGTCVSFCYRFDPRNNQWVRIANMIRGRCRFTASTLDGFIYVVGRYKILVIQNVLSYA